ncbi:MAG: TetR/AcrR family transcriptional regulator [Peptococcaceae bacterium]|nr:TetR/AcrR family transcriptional regulator [Peptococcaceae bacterium]
MEGEELQSLHDQVLDIIEDRLVKQGYRAMSVDDIAAAAGISKKTLYAMFKSKEDMASKVVDRVLARVEAEIDRLSAIADPLERFRREELAIVEIVSPIHHMNEHAKRPAVWARIDEFARRRRQHLRNLFREAQEKGLIRPGIQPEVIALMYDASMKTLVDDENRILYSIFTKVAVENALEIFLEGLKPR